MAVSLSSFELAASAAFALAAVVSAPWSAALASIGFPELAGSLGFAAGTSFARLAVSAAATFFTFSFTAPPDF